MPRLSEAIDHSFGLYESSRHARQGQHHLDCSLVSLSGISQALTNLCRPRWPRCSGRFQMYMLLIYIYIYVYIYIYKSQIFLPTLIYSHSLRLSIYLFRRLNYHFTTSCMRDRFPHHASYQWWFFITTSYAIWVHRRRYIHINPHTSNIANWHRNRTAKTISSHILSFEHGRRMNSTV